MANRWLRQFVKSADSEVCTLDGYVNLDSDGYTVLSDTLPLASVAYVSTGKYRITLVDNWSSLLGVRVVPVLKAAVADRVPCVTDVSLSSKTIDIAFHAGGSVQNLGAGNGFFISLILKNSGNGVGR